jgi:lipopolysaccharide export system protein LptA
LNKLQVLLFVIFIGVASFSNAQEQTKKKIEIEYAGKLTIDEENFPGAKVLTRDDAQQVHIIHRGANMWCDKAIHYSKDNFIEAYGNVNIKQGDTINMTSQYLEYSGITELAFASGDVILESPNSKISSDTLYFDRVRQQSFYKSWGTVVRDTTLTITSEIGRYYMDIKKFQFVNDVVLKSDDSTIESNFFDYYEDTGHAYLFGPSTITTEESVTYCEKGFYDTENDVGYALKEARIDYDNRIIEGDSLYFDNNKKFASATNNIKVTDTINRSIIKGHYAEVFKEKDSLFITKRALAITVQENDSIYMHAEKIMVTGPEENRIINAYYKAKIFKTDLSGKSDSINTNQKTGITKLINIPRFSPGDKFSTKRKPILWNLENQMTGDTIYLISNTETEKIDSLIVFNNAFIISKDTISKNGYNQIYGMRLVGKFNEENQLREVDITKNAESIFFTRDEKQELIGIDKAKSGSISMLFADGDIEEYTRFNQADGNLYPESQYPEKEKFLKGFDWREEERPKSVEDLFKDDLIYELPIIKGLEDYVPQGEFFDEEMLERIKLAGTRSHLKTPVFRKVLDPNDIKDYFQVILDVLVQKNDKFQLFYTLNPSEAISEKNSIWTNLKGSNEYQYVKFKFLEKLSPYNFRIDIGTNTKQDSIKIRSITFRYKNNEVFVPEHLIPKFLTPNEFIEKKEGAFNLKVLKVNNTIKYDPFFNCSSELLKKIKKLHLK